MPGLFSSKWGAALKEKIAAKTAKKEKRTEVRGKKKSARKDKREAVKKVRSETKPGEKRRGLVGATRSFHGTDKEGNKGGFKAFGKYGKKVAARKERKSVHKAKVASKRKARADKRSEKRGLTGD